MKKTSKKIFDSLSIEDQKRYYRAASFNLAKNIINYPTEDYNKPIYKYVNLISESISKQESIIFKLIELKDGLL